MHWEAEIHLTAGQSLAPGPPKDASKTAVKATHLPLRTSWTSSVLCRCKQAEFLMKDLWHHIYIPFSSTSVFIHFLFQLSAFLWGWRENNHYLVSFMSEMMFSWIQDICFLLGCQGKNPLTINIKDEGWLSFQGNSIVLNNIDDAEGHNPLVPGNLISETRR